MRSLSSIRSEYFESNHNFDEDHAVSSEQDKPIILEEMKKKSIKLLKRNRAARDDKLLNVYF